MMLNDDFFCLQETPSPTTLTDAATARASPSLRSVDLTEKLTSE